MFGFEGGEVEVYVSVEADDLAEMPSLMAAGSTAIEKGKAVVNIRWTETGGFSGIGSWQLTANKAVPQKHRKNPKQWIENTITNGKAKPKDIKANWPSNPNCVSVT